MVLDDGHYMQPKIRVFWSKLVNSRNSFGQTDGRLQMRNEKAPPRVMTIAKDNRSFVYFLDDSKTKNQSQP